MESIGLLRSRPRVNGTMQKLHMFSQPRMIELEKRGGGGRRRGEEESSERVGGRREGGKCTHCKNTQFLTCKR